MTVITDFPVLIYYIFHAERKSTLSANGGSTAALKMQTLTGMASKTSSVTVQKRQAHIPSLKVY